MLATFAGKGLERKTSETDIPRPTRLRRRRLRRNGHNDTLAHTLCGEARGELFGGRVAVGCEARNWVEKGGWFGSDIRSVHLQPCQFSC